MAPNTDMKIPVPVIGFGLVVIGRIIFGRLYARFLNQSSESVLIDASEEIVLRYAIWYYIYPLLGFAGSVLMGWAIYQGSPHPESIVIYKIIFLICFFGACFLLYRQLTARVKIFSGRLTYTEGGDRWELLADDVTEVSINGFVFLVRLKWQKTVRVPATFQHSEIILAFFKQAARTKIINQP
jgi:voltage-gated potassium channel Kch